MKKILLDLYLVFCLLGFTPSLGQGTATDQPQLVKERMAKARAAKAQKKMTQGAVAPGQHSLPKALPNDYKTPVDKVLKGPNGEAVHVGERGAKFYINKHGNKTYLSSNQ